jgi:hypothetical protein
MVNESAFASAAMSLQVYLTIGGRECQYQCQRAMDTKRLPVCAIARHEALGCARGSLVLKWLQLAKYST